MPCSSKIISEMLPEIHTMDKCYFFFKPMSFSNNVILCYTRHNNSAACCVLFVANYHKEITKEPV